MNFQPEENHFHFYIKYNLHFCKRKILKYIFLLSCHISALLSGINFPNSYQFPLKPITKLTDVFLNIF